MPKTQLFQSPKQPTAPNPRKSLASRRCLQILICCSFLMSGAALGFAIFNYLNINQPVTTLNSAANQTKFTNSSIAKVAAQVAPSVVSILTETRSTSWLGQSATNSSAGTGVIVSENGYILTNKHVVNGTDQIKVILDDGSTYKDVSIVAIDDLNDIAFLKIKNATNLKPASLGDSKTITVGQSVIAIGNALGHLQNSITSGIISGTGRSLSASSGKQDSESLTDMIQTDASINPGNSGGPLVNAAGQVIGINTAISANAQGIGFAIPIASVKGMLRSLLATGHAKRAYLGVRYQNITPEIAKAANLQVKSGAYLASNNSHSETIIKNSPAAKAGLKEKDIIVAVNGVQIGTAGSLSTLLSEYAAGDTVQLKVIRGQKEFLVKVTLSQYSDEN